MRLSLFAKGWAKPAISKATTSRLSTAGQGQLNRLPDLAADLVRRQVAVIVVNNAAARAARGATSVTPIVFVSGADPATTALDLQRAGQQTT